MVHDVFEFLGAIIEFVGSVLSFEGFCSDFMGSIGEGVVFRSFLEKV